MLLTNASPRDAEFARQAISARSAYGRRNKSRPKSQPLWAEVTSPAPWCGAIVSQSSCF